MKKRALVVAGMLAALALVVFAAAELKETRADEIQHQLGGCQEACFAQYMSDLDTCSQIGSGRERSACRKAARADSRSCVEACSAG